MNDYVRGQKRKRWCRHLQRMCGTKSLFEMLAFTGDLDLQKLAQAVRTSEKDRRDDDASIHAQQRRQKLQKAKAEAKALFNEGARLDRYHAAAVVPGHRPMTDFTLAQITILERFQSGELRRKLNQAIVNVGHGRLVSMKGDTLDIGGCTGGVSRRILDEWKPPDYRKFLKATLDS